MRHLVSKMEKTLSYLISEKAEVIQEGTFYVPSACNQLSFRHNLSSRYTFLVFVRVLDPNGKLRFQKQLANSEPVFQIGSKAELTTIGGISGEISPGNWTIKLYFFTEHLGRLLKGKEIPFQICISDQVQEITEHNTGDTWADSDFAYTGFDYTKVYQAEKRWYLGDLHTHTRLSDGKELPASANDKSKKMGLDYYIATEHNVLHTGWPKTKVLVMPGVEITSILGHANIFGLDRMPANLENFLLHKDMEQLHQDVQDLIKEKRDRNWLFSVNHPFLSIWQWNDDNLNLEDMDCLEIINDPTYAADKTAKAAEANCKAVLLSDLLWSQGYRICAVGGSDSHNLLDEWYEGAEGPSVPGDPGTYLYMDQLSPCHLLSALRKCNCYVTRHCKIETNLLFGSMLKQTENRLNYKLRITETKEKPTVFYLLNGQKYLCAPVKEDTGSYLVSGTIELPKEEYCWIRFGAEKENGDFLFYGNPITKGRGPKTIKKYGELKRELETLWKSKEYYLIKTEP